MTDDKCDLCPICGGKLIYLQEFNVNVCDTCDYEEIEVY